MNGGQYRYAPIQSNGSQPSYGAKSSSNNGNNNNNQNNETNVNSIGIDDALSQSSYLSYYKSFIRELIQDNYYEHKEAKVYFVDNSDEKNHKKNLNYHVKRNNTIYYNQFEEPEINCSSACSIF